MDFPITIVIPCYNREKYVKRTLDSVAAQTFRPLRVVLVDNNSTDGTLQLLQQWKNEVEAPDFQVEIRRELTPGACAARNCGAKDCPTPYLMFFDSDDLMAPTHVERAMRCFNSPQHPDMVGWDIVMVMEDGHKEIRKFFPRHTLWATIFDGGTATQRYAMRTDLFMRSGGWNTAIEGWNDIELGTRLLMLKPKVVKAAGKPTIEYFAHVDSITGANFISGADKWEGALDAIESNVGSSRYRRWVNLRRALLAGTYAMEEGMLGLPGENARSTRLLSRALASEKSPFYRGLMRLCFRRKRSGKRALSPLLRLVC